MTDSPHTVGRRARRDGDHEWQGAESTAALGARPCLLNGQEPSPHNASATVYYTWVDQLLRDAGRPGAERPGLRIAGEPARVAMVSESAARRLWPGQEPLAQLLRLGTTGLVPATGELVPDGPTWQVIGVVRDTRGVSVDGSDSQQRFYVPLPPDRAQDYPLVLKTSADPNLVMKRLEPAVAAVDPLVTVTAAPLRQRLRQTDVFLAASLSAAIAAAIGMCGLLLACARHLQQRQLRRRPPHPGNRIRMAIGATARDILAVVVRGSVRAVILGVFAGLALAAALRSCCAASCSACERSMRCRSRRRHYWWW